MSYVGKLIVSKGVDLLLAAWPLVVGRVPQARLCVVGFGTYRDTLHAFVDALAAADLPALRSIAARGREPEGGPAGELRYLASFLDGLEGERRDAYLRAAPAAAAGVVFTGRLEHDDLPALLPACRAQVVPSTFPEAFGMVAAEAACCGALPLSAAHSGLAEVTAALEPALEPDLRPLLSFQRGDRGGRGDRGQAGPLAQPGLLRARTGRRRAGRDRPRALWLGGRRRGRDRHGRGPARGTARPSRMNR